jgi:hypothetical protein
VVKTLHTLLDPGRIAVPRNAPLSERPGTRNEMNSWRMNGTLPHILPHAVEERASDTLLVVGIHERGMFRVLRVCGLGVFQGFIQHRSTLRSHLDLKADDVMDWVLAVESQRKTVVCKGVRLH